MNRHTVIVKGGGIVVLLLLIGAVFAARTFMASANSGSAVQQCVQAQRAASKQAYQDWHAYEIQLRQAQRVLAQSIKRDQENIQQLEKDRQLFAETVRQDQDLLKQRITKDLTLTPTCKGANMPALSHPQPTFSAHDGTPLSWPDFPKLPGGLTPPVPVVPTVLPTAPTPTVPVPTPTTSLPTIGVGTPEPTQAPVITSSRLQEDQLRQQLLALINKDRAAQGLPAYTLNETLSSGAYRHSVAMTTCGLSHQCSNEADPCQRMTNEGITWMSCGENVGYTTPDPDAWSAIQKNIEQGMLNEQPPDDGHRKNLLSSTFHQCGIGIVIDTRGTVWVTEDFTN